MPMDKLISPLSSRLTHTDTHTHTVTRAPSQHHDPTDPEACNIPFTLKFNGKLEFHLLASKCTCIHTRPRIGQRAPTSGSEYSILDVKLFCM